MIATDLACALDPAVFAQRAGLILDDWQRDLVRSAEKQVAMLCSRQSGKSTVAGVLAAHEALYRAPALVLCLSPSQRQSQELFRKVKDVLNATGGQITEESALRLELANGSRILALPGKDDATIRGYSGVSLLLIDEASRVTDPLYQSTRPMLAVSHGRLVCLSTPWGKRGWFHAEWTEGASDWLRVKVTAYECPRIDPEWLEKERLSVPDFIFRQEYLVEFTDTEDQVFSYELVTRSLSSAVTPLFAGVAA